MRKLLFTTIMASIMVLSMAACGTTNNPPADAETSDASSDTPAATTPETTPEPVTLNIATAGDTNMTEFFRNEIGPAFTAKYPHITINVVGTGAGDDGSRAIYTKWDAQKSAGTTAWDIDVACVHEAVMEDMIANGLVDRYVPSITNSQYVNTPASKMCLGSSVEGYVVPLFQSQIVLAYNPEKVQNPPKNFDELETWIKANPNKFGYNGVTGGMSGVGFVAAWLYSKTGEYDAIAQSAYDESVTETWPGILSELKTLPVVYTQGNAGTLDMLNRGEIDMGPVWVDMLLLWKSDGRMNPNIRMSLPEPGMPGQPMYMVIGAGSANNEAARQFCDFIADPAVQAEFVVGKYTWYPGVDAVAVFEKCTEEAKTLLFTEVTADEIAEKGLAMPIGKYREDLQRIFEEAR
jgi:ABC-type uncharacterized transport system YnjBCD substrate-binding protein